MKIVSVVSAKGGVGKTTIAANLASILANDGRRVVAVDLDPQDALRLHFGVPLDSADGLSRSMLAGTSWQSVMLDGTDNVTVLPYGVLSEDDQCRLEALLATYPDSIRSALDALALDSDDIVVIDTPPGPSSYTRAALTAATYVLNVVAADPACYAAIPQMQRLVDTYAAGRSDFAGYGYVINHVDPTRELTKDLLRVIRGMLGERLFPGVVHADQGLVEALAYGTTLIHYDPPSRAASDLRACAAWMLGAGRRPSVRAA